MFGESKVENTAPQTTGGKITPKLDFPEMRCSEHRSPIILVCKNPDLEKRIFLCSRCVAEHSSILKQFEPLQPYEDFVRYIHENTGLRSKPTEEAQKIVKQKNGNISEFINHINSQKYEVSQIVEKLNSCYENKCSELVSVLQEQLENEKQIFSDNYEKFQTEVGNDKEKDANMPKFHEIKQSISEMSELSEIEEYMRDIYRRKQVWQIASIELRTVGKRTEDYYRELIEGQQYNKPTFSQGESLIQEWQNGLEKLIGEVKSRANCFEHLFNTPDGIKLDISELKEILLLTNPMIKFDTELRFKFSGFKLTVEQAQKIGQHIQQFTNLRHFTLDFSQSHIAEDSLTALLDQVKNLTWITNFTFICQGSKNKQIAATALSKIIPNLANLTNLGLNFAFSDLHCQGAQVLAEATAKLTQLVSLEVQFQANSIKENGAIAWGVALAELKNLEKLSLNFGGYTGQKNKIKDEGAVKLVKAFGSLTRLTSLYIDLGFTSTHTTFFCDFALVLKSLVNLSSANIQLYNNQIQGKGGKKIAKALSKLPHLSDVTLNLNSSDLQNSNDFISVFQFAKQIKNLALFLRNVGISDEKANEYKTELSKNNYENFELLV